MVFTFHIEKVFHIKNSWCHFFTMYSCFSFSLSAYFESTEREIVLVFPKMEEVVTHDGDMLKLTAENYSYWKPMMEDHLYCKDLHEQITNENKLMDKKDNKWELLNWKFVAMIRRYIDRSLFEHVSTYTNAYELWTKLESLIQKKAPRNKAHLVRRLVKLEYMEVRTLLNILTPSKVLLTN